MYFSEYQRWQLFRDAMGCLMKGFPTQRPSVFQPSQEVVKEMIQFSKGTLEKIDKARSEGLYHEVKIHFYRGWGLGGGQKWSLVREGDGGEDTEATEQIVFLEDVSWLRPGLFLP